MSTATPQASRKPGTGIKGSGNEFDTANYGDGADHGFVLDQMFGSGAGESFRRAGSPVSGRSINLATANFTDANFTDAKFTGRTK